MLKIFQSLVKIDISKVNPFKARDSLLLFLSFAAREHFVLTSHALVEHDLITPCAPQRVLECGWPILFDEEMTHPSEEIGAHDSTRNQVVIALQKGGEGSDVRDSGAHEVE